MNQEGTTEPLRFFPENKRVAITLSVICAIMILCVGTYMVRGYIQAFNLGFDHFRAPHPAAVLTAVALVSAVLLRKGLIAGVVTLAFVLALLGFYQVVQL